MTAIDDLARVNAQRQWNTNPCGNVGGQSADLAKFIEVERVRYDEQDWMHDFFGYSSFCGKRVLEVGVGLGTDLTQFARAGAECHAVDITDAHLAMARANFASRGLPVTLVKADATQIPYPDANFDAVYSFGVLHHIPEIDACLSEIRRVLKPGGILMVGLYHKWSLFHLFHLMRTGLIKGYLFRAGYAGTMARVEQGADGIDIVPYIKTYSCGEVTEKFRRLGFVDLAVEIRHLKRNQFWPGLIGRLFSARTLARLSRSVGWYVCAKFRRNDPPRDLN
jgi:SAM-dependent methyltransferase